MRLTILLSVAAGLVPPHDVSVILLAGGVGSRMKADRPKQFLELMGKPVLQHSLELFLSLSVQQVVLVLDEAYRDDFKHYPVDFADPGVERQDSVKNGLEACSSDCALVCIHDAARPLVTPEKVLRVIEDAREHGAAVLGVPVKATVKESDDGEFVLKTLDRSRLWEIQTPQVVRPDLLSQGFKKVQDESLVVTDDASIIEQLGGKVKLTVGDYTNLKLTTPDDMIVAANILDKRQ